MNIKQIECFNALAKTLNFSNAAEMLYISQSAFSRIIASLEDELGCKLLERNKKEPRLTLVGERIYEKTKIIMEDVSEVRQIALRAAQGYLCEFSIGILINGLTELMKSAIKEFKVKNSDVNIIFKEYSETKLCKALEIGQVDIAILVDFPEFYRDIFNYIITEKSKTCVITYIGHPLANREMVSINELRKEDFIIIKQDKSELAYNFIMNICVKNGFIPNIIAQTDSISSLMYSIECKMGITIITDSVSRFSGNDIVMIPIENMEPVNHLLMWRKNEKKKVVEEFVLFTKYIIEQN